MFAALEDEDRAGVLLARIHALSSALKVEGRVEDYRSYAKAVFPYWVFEDGPKDEAPARETFVEKYKRLIGGQAAEGGGHE